MVVLCKATKSADTEDYTALRVLDFKQHVFAHHQWRDIAKPQLVVLPEGVQFIPEHVRCTRPGAQSQWQCTDVSSVLSPDLTLVSYRVTCEQVRGATKGIITKDSCWLRFVVQKKTVVVSMEPSLEPSRPQPVMSPYITFSMCVVGCLVWVACVLPFLKTCVDESERSRPARDKKSDDDHDVTCDSGGDDSGGDDTTDFD